MRKALATAIIVAAALAHHAYVVGKPEVSDLWSALSLVVLIGACGYGGAKKPTEG